MKRDSANPPSDRPSVQRPARAAEKPAGRHEPRGRSGYGIESLRPYLREQLASKELLRQGIPPIKPSRAKP